MKIDFLMKRKIDFLFLRRSTFWQNPVFWLWAGFFLFWILQVGHGPEIRVVLHDTLDGDVSLRKLLTENGLWFRWDSEAKLPMMMNGLPRNAIDLSGFNLINALFIVFSDRIAFFVALLLVHGMAAWGTYCLAKVFLEGQKLHWVLIALGFAFLPHYVLFGWTTAGLPYLTWATLPLLNREAPTKRQKWTFFFGWILYAAGAHFVLFGVFVWGGLVVFTTWMFFKKRANRGWLVFTCIAVLLVFLLQSSHLLANMFDKTFVSHRTTWELAYQHYPLWGVFREAAFHMLFGQYHAPSSHLITLIGLLATYWVFRKERGVCSIIRGALLVQFALSFWGAFWFWEGLIPIKETLGFFKSFNASRIAFGGQILWLMGLVLLVHIWMRWKPSYYRLVQGFLVLQLGWVFDTNTMFRENVVSWINPQHKNPAVPSWDGYFATEDWAGIKRWSGGQTSTYKVVSVGLHPAIAQYNGFHTLDSYQNNYEAGYKKNFRTIIANELTHSEKWRHYYDDWGSRCYILPAKTASLKNPFFVLKNTVEEPIPLLLDVKAFEKMGGKYLLSAYPLRLDPQEWDFVRKFNTKKAWYEVHLYQVKQGLAPWSSSLKL
ncbi:MAG: hypothetical protein J0L94_05230 [Rhodothermia bacterium]|nr:hypothetical protein [Rhodothermia bacterium]